MKVYPDLPLLGVTGLTLLFCIQMLCLAAQGCQYSVGVERPGGMVEAVAAILCMISSLLWQGYGKGMARVWQGYGRGGY